MTEVAIEMGANPVSAANDMQDVLQFELKLASISTLSGNMYFLWLIGYFYNIKMFPFSYKSIAIIPSFIFTI